MPGRSASPRQTGNWGYGTSRTEKIAMGQNRDTDYEAKKAAAIAQADPNNPSMWGIPRGLEELGAGEIAADSRSPQYGNPNKMTGEIISGTEGSFNPQADAAGNAPLENPMNQTGFLAGEVSSTIEPQVDPQVMGQRAESTLVTSESQADERIRALASGRQWTSLNNRQQVFGA